MSDGMHSPPKLNKNVTTLRMELPADTDTAADSAAPITFLRDSFEELYQPVPIADVGASKECALDANLRRLVELRVPDAEHPDEESVGAFIGRTRINAVLEHPNILPVHDLGVGHDDLPFSIVRHIRGTPLLEWLTETGDGSQDLNTCLGIWEDVCQAVGYAHSKKFAHTKVAPENVIVGQHGEVFLVNWDHATPLDGNPRARLVREDVQSVGRLLEIILQPASQTAIPIGLHEICNRATGTTGFYKTVEEVVEDVRRFRGGYPTHAEEAGLLRQALLFAKRHRKTVVVASLAISALILSGVLYGQALRRDTARLSGLRRIVEDRQKEAMTAVLATDEALQRRRKIAHVFAELGRSYLERGDIQAAEEQLARGKILNDRLPEFYMVSGDLHQSLFNMNQAIADYQMADSLGAPRPRVDAAISACQQYLDEDNETAAGEREAKLATFMFEDGRSFEALRVANASECPQALYNQIVNSVFANLNSGLTLEKRGSRTQLRNVIAGLKMEPVLRTLKTYKIERFDSLSLKEMTGFHSLEGFETMPLKELGLPFSLLQDIAACKSMELQLVDFSNCTIAELGPLTGQPVQKLHINQCPIRDLEPLRGAPLSIVACDFTQVDDLEPLGAGLRHQGPKPKWKALSLRRAPVFDLRPLRGVSFFHLALDGTQVEEIAALKDVRVVNLHLSNTKISDLSPLAGQKELRRLILTNCPNVKDLSPLRSLSTLQELRIENTGVRDLSPLKDLPIKRLGFTPKRIRKGLEYLQTMPNLEKIRTDATDWWIPAPWHDKSLFLKKRPLPRKR